MGKRAVDRDAAAFGERLVALLAGQGIPRRGAGAYLAGRYKVSTVTANDWLNGRFKPNTTTARAIAEDHSSTFDWLYFGAEPTVRLSTGLPTAAAQPVRLDPEKIADTTEVLEIILGRRGGRTLDLKKPSHAALFAEAYALRETLDDAPSSGTVFTATVIDLVAAMEERDRGERAREQDRGDAGTGARRKGAA